MVDNPKKTTIADYTYERYDPLRHPLDQVSAHIPGDPSRLFSQEAEALYRQRPDGRRSIEGELYYLRDIAGKQQGLIDDLYEMHESLAKEVQFAKGFIDFAAGYAPTSMEAYIKYLAVNARVKASAERGRKV